MSRIAEDRKWRCRVCSAESLEPALLKAPSPFDEDQELIGCPICKQCDEGFDPICDEAGCQDMASRGWPTGSNNDAWGGYRNTCGKHYESSFKI